MHLWMHDLLTINGSRERCCICWVYCWLWLFCGGLFFSALVLNDCIKSSWVSSNCIFNFCCYATVAFISKLLVFPFIIPKLSQFEIHIISSMLEKFLQRLWVLAKEENQRKATLLNDFKCKAIKLIKWYLVPVVKQVEYLEVSRASIRWMRNRLSRWISVVFLPPPPFLFFLFPCKE